jgi:NADH:ubiquinone oxidoreductase subunit K
MRRLAWLRRPPEAWLTMGIQVVITIAAAAIGLAILVVIFGVREPKWLN